MRTFLDLKEPYEAAMKGDWDAMFNWYKEKENGALLLIFPLSFCCDTAFHLAVHSGREQPLKSLLELIARDEMTSHAFTLQNASGNTSLHEAATCGNYKAVKLLVGIDSCKLTHIRNERGETPLFTAAAYGRNKIVKYLASLPHEMPDQKLKDIHRYRITETSDAANAPIVQVSILHDAIRGEHFGTALLLLTLDESLLTSLEAQNEITVFQSKYHKTALELLATIPSGFKSGCHMNIWRAFLYFCIPSGVGDDDDQNDECSVRDDMEGDFKVAPVDTESGNCLQSKNDRRKFSCKDFVERIYQSIWRVLFRVCSIMKELHKTKRKHKSAFELAQMLIRKDTSWLESVSGDSKSYRRDMEKKISQDVRDIVIKGEATPETTESSGEGVQEESREEASREKKDHVPSNVKKMTQGQTEDYERNPLFYATKYGIREIVKEILVVHPQAALSITPMWHNILHVAIRHRQKEIFDQVKRMDIPMTWLVRGIDKYGYTILHHAANMEGHTGRTRPGPAFQLQDELKWFNRVNKLMPSHYSWLHDKVKNSTAEDLFKESHKDQLDAAQKWIKDTSQSCSAVAVLVATVVFAAAYTVPGGSKDQGRPILLNSTSFLIFTVMDVTSLWSSLTSVETFLSVLTSPFEFEDFSQSLPRKLRIGFNLLFLSVLTTIIAFTATVFLIIPSDSGHCLRTFSYRAAFIPISIFALVQFPFLFAAFIDNFKYLSKVYFKFLPQNLLS